MEQQEANMKSGGQVIECVACEMRTAKIRVSGGTMLAQSDEMF